MTDPVDRVLEQLRSQRWDGPSRHERIEAAIIEAGAGPARPRRNLAIGIVAVLAGSAIVTATMTGAVDRLFVTAASEQDAEPRDAAEPAHEEVAQEPADEFVHDVETANN